MLITDEKVSVQTLKDELDNKKFYIMFKI